MTLGFDLGIPEIFDLGVFGTFFLGGVFSTIWARTPIPYTTNGWSSEFFSLSRGVRQGCPLPPYLFILCAEILANAVRKDKEIRGINIGDMECKLSQYADDTTTILDGSQLSFSRTLFLLDIFTDTSGLKVNYEKTEALWIGSYKDRAFTIPSSKPVTWTEGKVYALGVQFSTSEINESSINFCEKMRKILSSWSAKKLTLLGKIAVLKSLVVSQIVYVLSSLPTPQGVIKEINSLSYEFLWGNKSDKIKRTEMINDYNKGGLKMIDLQSFNQSLKIKWIKGYLDENNQGKWKSFFDYYLEKHGGKYRYVHYIEDITWPRVDTNFIFECSTRYLTSELRSLVRYRVEHEKIIFVSTSGHVIFCLLYRHR